MEMRKLNGYLAIFALTLFLSGCATTTSDMAYSDRGFEELSKHSYQKAEEYLEKALEINPNNPYAILNMGVVYQNTGRPEKAREMYNKVIEMDSKAAASRSNKDWAVGKELADIARKNLQTL